MVDVVIGAAFGDEGKGLITHHLASHYGKDAVVVRFNGGAQAGHTVVTHSAQRHIFRHVGSGAFAGAATFLSRFFVSNPILFLEEIETLQHFHLKPKVYVDPESPLTTPYDMMINQIVEECRGEQRHGSCGVGFAETIERNLHSSFSLIVADLENTPKIINTLQSIRTIWLPQRLKALNIASLPEQWRVYIESDDIFQFYIHNLSLFLQAITISRLNLTTTSHPLIFEGAQGLMLDQESGWFPHVTRSHTGLKNVIQLLQGINHEKVNVIYVTRSYLTRHGAGPLPYELSALPYKRTIDKTNITNRYQGSLRYAWFNLTLLKSFIQADLRNVPSTMRASHQLAITCLDQVDDHINFINDGKVCQVPQMTFLQKLAKEVSVSEILCSYGPTIDTLKKWQASRLTFY